LIYEIPLGGMRRVVSMRRASLLSLLVLLAAALSFAGPQAAKKEAALRCTLTNKIIEKCCCVQKDGKTYCPLAKKTVEKCCCESASKNKGSAPKKG
jgi:hypothetical protein